MLYPGISLEGMLHGFREQYLQKKGWLLSVERRAPVDEAGGPIPWLTYPAIAFLAKAVRPEFRVFEFGCGSSTVWWGRRVSEVHSIDHDPYWLERYKVQCGANVDIRLISEGSACDDDKTRRLERYFSELPDPPTETNRDRLLSAGILSAPFRAYAADILRFPPGYFDVIVIDGMARSLTTWLAVHHAQPKKFIVFDNSDREAYAPAYAILKAAGYRRIDFWGSGPINPYEWCTSVFLRDISALP